MKAWSPQAFCIYGWDRVRDRLWTGSRTHSHSRRIDDSVVFRARFSCSQTHQVVSSLRGDYELVACACARDRNEYAVQGSRRVRVEVFTLHTCRAIW